MMIRLLKAGFLSLLLAVPAVVCATAQMPDKIRIDGKEHALNTNPLSGYLQKQKWQPPEEAISSTANWRGYVAHWEIIDKRLTLTDVTIRVAGAERGNYVTKSILRNMFPSQTTVVADWYSGALIIPQGKITQYVHMGYGSSFERYQVFRIASGKVTERLALTAAQFERYKTRKFEEFSRTDEFKKAYQDLRRDGTDLTEQQMLDFIKSYFAERYLAL